MNWPAVAERLAVSIPRGSLHTAVLRWAETSPPTARWALALSGGVDSVALLLLLWAHFPERRTRMLALHFNHRLRGRASAGDVRFCAALCAGLGVACVVGKREGKQPYASEAEARAGRMAFFAAALKRRRAMDLFTGHHRDDVAETLFMRLARGAGAAGLSAPRPVHDQPSLGRVHLRPLLSLDKSELAAALRAAGGRWREDASNDSPAYLRNRVRAELIPAWRSAADPGRDALAGLALTRDLLEEDDAALEDWAGRAFRPDARGGLALTALRKLPRAVLRRVIHRWLATTPARTDLNRVGFNALLDLAATGRTGAKHSLGREHFALITRTRLRCVSAET
ncbi:MAG: tRNA lysidine(34) synthetase TilS [Verrucomicrobia bacterium]|nr:tRNA lysidine(34) synthetase TilS [Verrucomicrobiota bacterium]